MNKSFRKGVVFLEAVISFCGFLSELNLGKGKTVWKKSAQKILKATESKGRGQKGSAAVLVFGSHITFLTITWT